jgi:hypothetical protein
MAAEAAVASPITAGAAATRVDIRAATRATKEDLGVKFMFVQEVVGLESEAHGLCWTSLYCVLLMELTNCNLLQERYRLKEHQFVVAAGSR